MPRMLGILILVSLAAIIACGGSRMTVREYAEECGYIFEEAHSFNPFSFFDIYDYEYADDGNEAIEDLKQLIRDFKALNPPTELQDFHDTRVAVLESSEEKALPILEDALSLMEDAQSAVEDDDEDKLEELEEKAEELQDKFEEFEEFEELAADAGEAREDLSSINREILRDSDCF